MMRQPPQSKRPRRPADPNAQAKQALRKLYDMSPDQAAVIVRRAGILTPTGRLSKIFR